MISPDAAKKLERIARIQESMDALERELEDLLGGGGGPKPLTIRDRQNDLQRARRANPPEVKNENKNRYSGTDDERNEKALGMLNEGVKVGVIAQALGCSPQTIYNLKSQFKKKGVLKIKPREFTVTSDTPEGALSEDDFWEVKSKKASGIRVPEIATLMERDEGEVGKAYGQGNYEMYLKAR